MWSLHAWRRQRQLRRHAVDDAQWATVCDRLPLLDGLDDDEQRRLREASVLFLLDKRVVPLDGLVLADEDLLCLAAQAQLPLLHLPDLDWYANFHAVLVYPDDFVSPQRQRDEAGVEHVWDDERSGESWAQGPVILAWPGVAAGGGWEGHNLVIHEMAHKLDMLAGGDANGQPPLHRDMRISDWAGAMQAAFDDLNARLDPDPEAVTPLDPYAAQSPAEFFAVASEYFFSAPDLLHAAYPDVHAQLALFYRQSPLERLRRLQAQHPDYHAS